jgi:drug/metabolite transporter (DMT)-like permease
MNKLMIFPIIIAIIQIASFGHLYYIHKHGSGQFPADFIELNILAVCNIGVLILAYFFYFKADIKLNIWLVPILLSTIIIALLLVIYIIMGINKYK